jgi:hypothetical protein
MIQSATPGAAGEAGAQPLIGDYVFRTNQEAPRRTHVMQGGIES